MISAPHILVFDSGIGGLSIVQHIRQHLPKATISYLADNLYFPYGLLDEATLTQRANDIVSWACRRYQPSVVVIACNSASTLVLPSLRERLDVPVVGVVPAIKPAAQMSKTKVIGLLATPATIQRDYTDELIAEFAPHCEVIRVGTASLVEFVEQKMAGLNPPDTELKRVIAQFEKSPLWPKADTVVLACTHFPLITQELSSAAPGISHWVDSGDAVARRIKSLLASTSGTPQPQQGVNRFLFTDGRGVTDALKNGIQLFGFDDISIVT